VIGSHRERSALAVEGDAGGIILRRLERSALVATNHFTDRELASRQSWTTHGRRIDSEIRFRRAEEILFGGNLPLEVSRMASILGDSHDPESGRERAFGGTIAQAHTISSVIFDPGEKRVYLASGEIPVSKGCYSAYRCFPGPVPTEGDLPSEPFSAKRAGRARYLEAFHRYFPTGDFQGVREDLERAREADPQESLYPFLLGLFHLKAVDPERALHWIEQAERLHEVDWRKSLFRLFRARALDLAGRRKEGVEVYRSLCGDPLYSRPARRGMRRPWSGRESRKLRFDFMTGEPFGSG
jgi:tetratricopeptide (TPR) repeat protein